MTIYDEISPAGNGNGISKSSAVAPTRSNGYKKVGQGIGEELGNPEDVDGDSNNVRLSLDGICDGDEFAVDEAAHHRDKKITAWDYIDLLVRVPHFRYYFASATCMHIGDWFVQVALLLVVEELSEEDTRGEALGLLVASSMLPKPLFAPIGGLLSDSLDRRKLMIAIDAISGITVSAFLIATYRRSLLGVYIVSSLRSSLESLYYPVTTGILPMLVQNSRDLQVAATMNAFAWSLMAIFGGLLAGTASSVIGFQACFVVDATTFLSSAFLVYVGIKGSYSAVKTPGGSQTVGVSLNALVGGLAGVWSSIWELISFLWSSGIGWNTLLKPSANAVWAIESLVAVAFSDVPDNESLSSVRMGLFFSMLGIGCFVGPLLVNFFGLANAKRPATLQRVAVIALAMSTLGWILIATTARSFGSFLGLTVFRTMGSGIAWVNSTLILQTLAGSSILGRVLAVEYALANTVDALTAYVAGQFQDTLHLDGHGLAWVGAIIGFGVLAFWVPFHFCLRLGAPRPEFNTDGPKA